MTPPDDFDAKSDALVRLATAKAMVEADFDQALRSIVETAAETLDVARASIWLYDDARTAIRCAALFERGTKAHSSGLELEASRYPEYFRALSEERAIAANDAHTDPRTAEFSASYLTPLGISSMLDAPIRVQGRMVGVACHEQLGPPRQWTAQDQLFAASLADLAALALEGKRRRTLEEQLQQAQKMEAIGLLAGGISHDFNNLLTVIVGHTELVLERGNPDDATKRHLTQIRAAADSASALIRQLLAFARRQTLQPRVLDLNDLLRGVSGLLSRLIGDHVELRVLPAAGLWSVRADYNQLEQVLMNLAVNAKDAMPKGGTLTLATGNVTRDGDSLLAAGDYVRLRVSDTGSGMDEATRLRIFEPFFTTKRPSHGTGLGLSTVYGIVKQSGGAITVTSELGRGSVFEIFLPRV